MKFKYWLETSSAGLCAVAAMGTLIACTASSVDRSFGDAVALDGDKIVSYDLDAPSQAVTSATVTGVDGKLIGIDIRPGFNFVYGISSTSKIYMIEPVTGEALQIGNLLSLGSTTPVALNGTAFDIDFDTAQNAIRVVSDKGQNLLVDPDTGLTTVDPAISGAAVSTGGVTGYSAVAVASNYIGTCSARVYAIDATTDRLFLQGGRTGVTTVVGPLGVDASAVEGFDIVTDLNAINRGYAAMKVGGSSKLYSINLATGAATEISPLAGDYSGLSFKVQDGTRPVVYGNVVGVTITNRVVTFNRENPGSMCSNLSITGLSVGENFMAIDYREDGTLWGLTQALSPSTARLYTIDKVTGAATLKFRLASAFNNGNRDYAMVFEPVSKKLRITNGARENWLVDPNDGTVAVQSGLSLRNSAGTSINPSAVVFAGVAFNAAGSIGYYIDSSGAVSTSTTTYDRLASATDFAGGRPVIIGGSETNYLRLLSTTGDVFQIDGINGFEIDKSTGVAYYAGSATTTTPSALYTINLTNQVVTPYIVDGVNNVIGSGERMRDIALVP